MKITFKNKIIEWPINEPIYNLIKHEKNYRDIYAVIYNGKLHDLNWMPKKDGVLELVLKGSSIANQIYLRSLIFLFIGAINRLHKNAKVKIENSISDGLFCEVLKDEELSLYEIEEIKDEMKSMVKQTIAFERDVLKTSDAIKLFKKLGQPYKAELLAMRNSPTSSVYHLESLADHFYGILLKDTSYLDEFTLLPYANGLWLSYQNKFIKQPKLFEVFKEFERWGEIIGVSHVAQLNKKINEGKINEVVLMSETMADIKIHDITDDIIMHKDAKFILISGPSSAGKTTTSNKLSVHLKIYGKNAHIISMDDFFKEREDTPRFSDGSYDFENPLCVDLDLFNKTLNSLIKGEEVSMPRFDFKQGRKVWDRPKLKLAPNDLLIIEGIHALNPMVTEEIEDKYKYKIYLNALTHLNLDDHNRIPTSIYRLIRRIARDYRTRGRSAKATISNWESVSNGEDKYIFPYQEEADAIFNTSLIYEMCILKDLVLPLVKEIKPFDEEYFTANRIRVLLEYFTSAKCDIIPRSSVLAEFIGTSIFDVQ